MSVRKLAQILGRRGGRARARNLSPRERKEIASLGGRAKALSRHAARRIQDNFRYLDAVEALRKITRVLRVASTQDLLRLKKLAYADRQSAADAQDLEFLSRLIKKEK